MRREVGRRRRRVGWRKEVVVRGVVRRKKDWRVCWKEAGREGGGW